jgi:hypothetical protein
MVLPQLPNPHGTRQSVQDKFSGLNHTLAARDGAIYDMANLSSREYPLLSTRFKRYSYGQITEPYAFGSRDALYWVAGTEFFYDGLPRGELTAGKKAIANMGAYVVIFPDKKYYNVLTNEFGDLGASYTSGESQITLSDGTYKGVPAVKNTLTTSGTAFPFEEGDVVEISGITGAYEANNLTAVIQEISTNKKTLRFLENTFTWTGSATSITIPDAVTAARNIPDLDFITECNNRLWGCAKDTIYASALGNIFNWELYDLHDDNSWTTEVGSAGDFTGCTTYRNYPIFFKEHEVYKIFGDLPSNFQSIPTAALGLQAGSDKSLVVVSESLFYQSYAGIVQYDGGLPILIDAPFGGERFNNGVAGGDGIKYYITMTNNQGVTRLYVYDTQLALWHIEDNMNAYAFAVQGVNLYALEEGGGIWIMGNVFEPPGAALRELDFDYFAEFGDFYPGNANTSQTSKILIRYELRPGSTMTVKIRYNSMGGWLTVKTLSDVDKRSQYLPVIPHRCDHFRLRIEGTGELQIYSLALESYIGTANKSRR